MGKNHSFVLERYRQEISRQDLFKVNGKVRQLIGLVIESEGPAVSVGELCWLIKKNGVEIPAEVVGFRENKVLLMPLGHLTDVAPGSEVVAVGHALSVRVGKELLGRVLDGLGNPMDGLPPPLFEKELPLEAEPPSPLERVRITEPLPLGVRSIDGLLTIGKGQRIGIFAGSGVGKSTLLGMIARNTEADVNVIGLIGERGREVRDFIERDLGSEGLSRSVVIAATSDQPALIRIKGAMVATVIAEFFRDLGYHVNLMMDSITRFAMAQREVGLAIGEPPTTRGFTPSVFAMLPKLLERSGTSARGSITGLYTILVEADDFNEPISDAIRAILDGHIVLSRELAARNQYPPVDLLNSVSRLMNEVASLEHRQAAQRFRELLATYKRVEDLIHIGAYVAGNDPRVDYAISKIEEMLQFMQQGVEEQTSFQETVYRLLKIFEIVS